jgi:dethiobiotin synthetase
VIRLAVTGTDTGVGKTVVTAAIVAHMREAGLRVGAMKPAETGRAPDDDASDAALLRAAAGGADAMETVRPLLLPEPLAPWVAAERAGMAIDLDAIDSAFRRMSDARDAVVVEGAGGLLVPITRDLAYDGLFARWDLDLVIVAGNRLGVLNHALLTLRAAQAAGLRVRGIVLNELSADGHAGVAEGTNLAVLRTLAAPVPVLPFPWLGDAPSLAGLARAAADAELDALWT